MSDDNKPKSMVIDLDQSSVDPEHVIKNVQARRMSLANEIEYTADPEVQLKLLKDLADTSIKQLNVKAASDSVENEKALTQAVIDAIGSNPDINGPRKLDVPVQGRVMSLDVSSLTDVETDYEILPENLEQANDEIDFEDFVADD